MRLSIVVRGRLGSLLLPIVSQYLFFIVLWISVLFLFIYLLLLVLILVIIINLSLISRLWSNVNLVLLKASIYTHLLLICFLELVMFFMCLMSVIVVQKRSHGYSLSWSPHILHISLSLLQIAIVTCLVLVLIHLKVLIWLGWLVFVWRRLPWKSISKVLRLRYSSITTLVLIEIKTSNWIHRFEFDTTPHSS